VKSGKHPDFGCPGPVQPYPAVTDGEYKKLSKSERKQFKRCPECGKWFDMRELDDVFFHCVDQHIPKTDVQFRSPDIKAD